MADLRTLIMIPLILVFEPPDPVQAVSDVILHAEEGSSVLLPCGVHVGNGERTNETTKLKWTRDDLDFATDLPNEEPRCVPEFAFRCRLFSNGSLQIKTLQESDDDYRYHCRRGKGDDDFPVFSVVVLMIHKKESPNCIPQGNAVIMNGQTFGQSDYEYNLQMELNFESSSNNSNSVGINSTVTSENGLASSCIILVPDVDDCSSNPCANDGTCTDELFGFTCNCTSGWRGLQCDVEVEAQSCAVPITFAVVLEILFLLALCIVYCGRNNRKLKIRRKMLECAGAEPLNSVGNSTRQGNDTPREETEQLTGAFRVSNAEPERKLCIREEEHDKELKRVKEQFESRRAQTQKEHDKELKYLRTRLKEERDDLVADHKAEFDASTPTKYLLALFLERLKKRTDIQISSSEMTNAIYKLTKPVARRNVAEFERMTKTKQKDNPKFPFLFGGEHSPYYKDNVKSEQLAQGNSTEEEDTAVSHPVEGSSTDNSLLSSSIPVDTSRSERVGDPEKPLKTPKEGTTDAVPIHTHGGNPMLIEFTFELKGPGLLVYFHTDDDEKDQLYTLDLTGNQIKFAAYDGNPEDAEMDAIKLEVCGIGNKFCLYTKFGTCKTEMRDGII